MKIGVVGCGAVGGYYGARLLQGGHDVHFLSRSDYETVRDRGVRVISPAEEFTVYPQTASEPERIGVCDLVVIGLKTTANREFPRLIPPLVGARTMVLTLQNGLGNEEALARFMPGEQILGGLCFVCLNRTAPGVIRHLAHGRIVLGEYRRGPEKRTMDLADTFAAAGIPCTVVDDLERAHWEKLIWNIPFNGLGVAGAVGYDPTLAGDLPEDFAPGPCLATDALLEDERWERLTRVLMGEVIHAAQAVGFGLEPSLAEVNIERTRCMGAYRASTLLDFEAGRPLELDGMFLEPQRQARAAGAKTPLLDRLCAVLRRLDARAAGHD